MDWNVNFTNMLGEATELMRTGNLMDATEAIQRALSGQSPPTQAPTAAPPFQGIKLPARPAARKRTGRAAHTQAQADVQDAIVKERTAAPGAAPAGRAKVEQPGSFERVAFVHAGVRHHYRLYVPPGAAAGKPMPLVLMLHGCTQDADDFATGTGMNQAAAPANALVLYAAQSRNANPNGCWNWFEPEHQQRGSGEPALLVAMVHDVMARHPVDAQRVYAAGLSAGGAMAALLGREYPDVFAAVGVHSGLQAGAAHNMMAALSAMNNGAKPTGQPARARRRAGATATPALIVFHGDADNTVHAKNGEQLVDAALEAAIGADGSVHHETLQGQSPAGQRYTRTLYRRTGSTATGDNGADVLAEHWVLHSAGHAWSGGDARGSHTDARGVKATDEMLRFFLAHSRAA
ncbi:MAG: PHB depolymerase family esterase [Simplicispira sp.]|nr:PHB depolymerase family esterase [Simplicispira sp.]